MQFSFSLTLFLSAALLFVIQPMVAKVLLPVYGGTPAVWTVCMLFFQALLLLAYAYAWFLSRLQHPHSWKIIHFSVCFLSLLFLPVQFTALANADFPERAILVQITFQLGLPLLVVAASAPLLQYTFSQIKSKRRRDPYFLYAASNSGSLLALLCYPWLIERFFKISGQFYYWNGFYVIYMIFLWSLLFYFPYQPHIVRYKEQTALSWKRRLRWIFLSFIPCSLMLGVTFYITTDVAATPLLWVIPLALYLLSYVLTFAQKKIISHAWIIKNAIFFLIFPVLGFVLGIHKIPAWQSILVHLANFFVFALLCHGELAETRPSPIHLTSFYFCIAVGGVLAGIFNGLLAPVLFNGAYEYPLILLLSLLAIPAREKTSDWLLPVLILSLLLINFFLPAQQWLKWVKSSHVIEVVALAAAFIFSKNQRTLLLCLALLLIFIFIAGQKSTKLLAQQRNFYGIKEVHAQPGAHVLMSQSTLHGFQLLNDPNSREGIQAYYGAVLPVIREMQRKSLSLSAVVIGLGTGIMVCQFRERDKLTMVEIDAQVMQIAQDPTLFTYLRDCNSQLTLLRSDGRLALKEMKRASLDLLVIDAFTSDAIPVHLLSTEAFSSYRSRLKRHGVILVNISNRHLRILPIVAAAGRQLEMIVLHLQHPGDPRLGQVASEWALLTFDTTLAFDLLKKEWRFVEEPENVTWTDDYSTILPLLKF
ncbi:fused MFS/spermidine synthase [Legionella sp. 27cVA30]|uniref:spermidine synthase n=1 Tax=Legionella sp. 27cVA30 TaxID=2905657 RepID=UPI00209EBAEF|nr:fused MFS/spermidine synthase [Legionella sp. 27cVA30]